MVESSLAFSVSEFKQRLLRVQEKLKERNLVGMLVHTPENICYLTGYQSPGYFMYQCLIVPAEGEPLFVLRNGEVPNLYSYS